MKPKTLIMICRVLITLSFFLTSTDMVYALDRNDKIDKLASDDAPIFSPGYINVAKQQTEAIVNQSKPKKSMVENVMEVAKNMLSMKVDETSDEKVVPELVKKIGASEDTTSLETLETNEIGDPIGTYSTKGSVNIGSGIDQHWEGGRLISEVIDGTRHIYAGFDSVGVDTIQSALARAAEGDAIIVKEGTHLDMLILGDNDIVLQEYIEIYDIAVSLYGGYDENGIRDIDNHTSTIGAVYLENINSPMEISGFTVENLEISNCSNLNISDNTFTPNLGIGYGIGVGAWLYNTSDINITHNTFLSRSCVFLTFIFNLRQVEDGHVDFGLDIGSSSNISISNNTFDTSIGIGATGSTVSSTNNKFNGEAGFYTSYASATISSSNDEFSREPTFGDITQIAYGTSNTLATLTASDPLLSWFYYHAKDMQNETTQTFYFIDEYINKTNNNVLPSLFKGILENRAGVLSKGFGGDLNEEVIARLVDEAIMQSTLAIPAENMAETRAAEMNVALRLAAIIENPTDDQKLVIDVAEAILEEISKIEGEVGKSPELKKTLDDVFQAAAGVLLAQAIPDLLKEGDIASIKSLFSSLDIPKTKFILEYHEATKPYYEQIRKIIEKNMNILKLHNLLSNNMTKEELEKMPRNELDKIIEKMKRMEKKAFEEEYILQEETKLREKYIEPNKKLLEERTKKMLDDFTKRINKILEAAEVSKAKAKK